MAESIKVVIRFRGKEELAQYQGNNGSDWQFYEDEKSLSIPSSYSVVKGHSQKQAEDQIPSQFTFDNVMDGNATQEKMYRVCAHETIQQFMKGYNGTIFAYGQSGSGKTYTMLGPDEVVEVIKKGVTQKNQVVPIEIQSLYGIIPRAIFDIFREINKQIEMYNAQFEIRINYFEIYQESLNNLISTNPQAQSGLKIREQKNGSVVVLNCDPVYVTCPEDIFEVLMIGQRNRAIASTNQNERSSRSHTIVVIEYTQKNPDGSMKQAKLNLVDLAGSERISKTGATGKTLEEAKKINLSLTTLGICIKSLTEGKTHVPFRDSKLTFFLKESLGGNSKTTLVCTASRKYVHVEESVQTLKFAQRAKKIKNKAISNVIKSPKEMEQLIQKLKLEVQSLKKQLVDHGLNPLSKPLQASESDQFDTSMMDDISDLLEITNASESQIISDKSVITKALVTQGEDLTLKITELQNEYEHYKEYADTRIMELEDQIERHKQQNESKEELLNKIQGKNYVIQDLEDEIKKIRRNWEKEKNALTSQVQSLENHLQAKDLIFKDLEQNNDELRLKVEVSGFNIFDKIKKRIFTDNFQAKVKTIESQQDRKMIEEIQKEIEQMESKYSNQELQINKLQDENTKLRTRIQQMEFFALQDGQLPQNIIEVDDESFSQTEIMSLHSQEQNSNSNSGSDHYQTNSSLQQIHKVSYKSVPNMIMRNNESSHQSRQSFNNSGSSSTYTKHSFFKSSYQQYKVVAKQLMEITLDNIKLIQMNSKLLEFFKQTHPTVQDQLQKAALIEQEIYDLQLQRQYLEHALHEKKQSRPDFLLQEQSKKQQEQIKLMELTLEQLKSKSIDLEEENQMLKKQISELKKQKNMNQLEQAKIIRDSVSYLMQQNEKGRVIKPIVGLRAGREVITKKVDLNEDILSQASYHDDIQSPINKQTLGEQNQRELIELLNQGVQRSKPQIFNFKPTDVKKTINLKQGQASNQLNQLMKKSVDVALKNPLNQFSKDPYQSQAGIKNKAINQLIAQANPEHDGIIKTFHGKQNDFIGELDDILNDDSDDDDDASQNNNDNE